MWSKGEILVSFGLVREKYSETVTTSESTIAQLTLHNAEFIMVEVQTTGSALTSFTIQMRGHPIAPFSDMFKSSEDYTNPKGLLRGSSCDLTTLNGNAWIMLDTRGVSDIKILASSSSSTDIELQIGG